MIRHVRPHPREHHDPIEVTHCQAATCRPEKHGGPRPALRGTTVCHDCETRAHENLTTLARTWPALDTALTTRARAEGERVTGSAGTPAPANLHALTVRDTIGGTLTFWVGRIHDTAPTLPLPSADPPAQARWLATHLDHLTRRPQDDTFPESICVDARDMARQAHRAAYPDGSRPYRPGIPCQTPGCGGEYVTRVGAHYVTVPDLRCTADPEHRVPPAGFRALARKVGRSTP